MLYELSARVMDGEEPKAVSSWQKNRCSDLKFLWKNHSRYSKGQTLSSALIPSCSSSESREGVWVMKSKFGLFQKDFGDGEKKV